MKKSTVEVNTMKNKIILGIIAFVIFFAGVGIGNSDENPVVEKEVIKEVAVEKSVEKTEWKELKTIDDQVFVLAGEILGLCGEGYKAILAGNVSKLEEINEKTNENTARINSLSVQRQALLKKL